MLILLQPGIEPLGQFDLEDDDTDLVRGGEVAAFVALNVVTDGYAADVFQSGPQVHLSLDSAGALGAARGIWGLVDEGTSAGVGGRGYGTMFGQMIGTTVGQGTGVGGQSTVGTVVVGPSTVRGSGKATLWTKPGLYGVTSDAWAVSAQFDAAVLNDKLYGTAANGTLDGKLTTGAVGVSVGAVIGLVDDTSLVSTARLFAGLTTPDVEYCALYLVGAQV
jgi:hypothetical protein